MHLWNGHISRLGTRARSGSAAPFDWATLDGRSAAPTGAAQYPTYFTSLNGITPYPARPPWQVPGVDYRVGINTGVTLASAPTSDTAQYSVSGNNITIQADGVTFDGIDFTGKFVSLNGCSNTKFKNCKFTSFCVWGANKSGGLLTMEYCEFDGLGISGDTSFGTILSIGNYPTTIRYCYFHDCQQDVVNVGMPTVDCRYCLFDTIGYMSGAHADCFQFSGNGAANNIRILFNTYVHTKATVAGPSAFIDCEPQLGTDATTMTMDNPELAYNVASYTFPGQTVGSTFIRIGGNLGGTVTNAFVHDNWVDPTNMLGVLDERSPGTNYVKTNNKLLTTGEAF